MAGAQARPASADCGFRFPCRPGNSPDAMPDTIPPMANTPETATETATELATLRAELDRLDDGLHDLLMQRAAVVERVGALRGKVPLRAGREAAILRRLVARHAGRLPAQAVVRIWRELLAGTTAMQAQTLISVCDGGNPAMTALAREHFGALTPLHGHRTPAQAIRELGAGSATVAVLPMPAEEGEPGSWWTALLHKDERRIHVIARLPFWAPRNEGAPQEQALVVGLAPPDPSGDDRSLVGFESAPDLSRARLAASLAAAGLGPRSIIVHRAGGQTGPVLVEVEGFVRDGDPRLAAIPAERPPVVLGAYAVPLEGPHP
jgi:chorismate mutase / prephenate dehydratase